MLHQSFLLTLTACMLAIITANPMFDYEDSFAAPGLEEDLKTTDIKELIPYADFVERITYCNDRMAFFPRSFLLGGSKHQAMSQFPEFKCDQMSGSDFSEAFNDCALCFRTQGTPLEPVYLLDMRYTHTRGQKPKADFFVWSHPKNIFRGPFFKDQKFVKF